MSDKARDKAPNLCVRDLSRLGWAKFDENYISAAAPGMKEKIGALFVLEDDIGSGAIDNQVLADCSRSALYVRYAVRSLDHVFGALMRSNKNLLLLLHVLINRYRPSVLTVTANGVYLAQIHCAVPSADKAWIYDLSTTEMKVDEVGLRALDLDPVLPKGIRQWSCTSNELYGMRQILLEAAGIQADLPIMGKLQHSWQPGFNTGIDGEWGFKPEVTQLDLPVYVWSAANEARAKEENLKVTRIGAPALYMPAADAITPDKSLLAFPTHSIGECVAVVDQSVYVKDLRAKAASLGFGSVTVCLHHEDYASCMQRVGRAGADVVTIGSPRDPSFLFRLRDLIQNHAAVTSDRVSTSGLYAMLWDRPFFVHGKPIPRVPPAYDKDDLTGSAEWVFANFGDLVSRPTIRKDLVVREFGTKLSPDELRSALWGWLL